MLDVQAPRDVEHLAGDVARLLAREVDDGAGDVLGPSEASQRDAVEHRLLRRLRQVEEREQLAPRAAREQ